VRRVAVVGAGIAGTAAALAASGPNVLVTLVRGRPGATVLGSGALDRMPWEAQGAGNGDGCGVVERAVLAALDAYSLPEGGVVLATGAGLVRPACGADLALLDLSSLSGTIVVPAFDHPGWDGKELCRAWSDAAWAKERSLSFVSVAVQLTRYTDEHALADADLAERHDEPGRLAWLARQLGGALEGLGSSRRPSAILLPAWLGVERARARELSDKLGLRCGEVLTGSGGPCGLRFERARDRALDGAGVRVVPGRVIGAVAGLPPSPEWSLTLETGEPVTADAVVLATGGFIGGGLEYTPAGSVLAAALPPRSRPLARVTIDAPVTLGAFERALETPSSLSGSAAESHAWPYVEDPLLDHVGVRVDGEGRVAGAPAGLLAAGELIADRPRTWLEALASGARAGALAARPTSGLGAMGR
jgi:hypothetical protein